jgi:hypothetical protein
MTIGLLSSGNSANIVPKRTKVNGSIQHSFASLAIVETFRNKSAWPAASCGLHINSGLNFIVYNVRVRIGGTDLDFTLREIDEADATFQQATAQGHIAGIGLKNESSDALHLDRKSVV